MITHNIVSFYVRADDDNLSHIKFGDWDVLKTNGTIYSVRPRNGVSSW
jgi:hypothetical protein